MPVHAITIPTDQLVEIGLAASTNIHYQLSPDELIQQTLNLKQGVLSDTGALVINTGEFTGRSPEDRFFCERPSYRQHYQLEQV